MITNLLEYSRNTQVINHVIFTIEIKNQAKFTIPDLAGAASTKTFYYSGNWNFYYTCGQLAKLLPEGDPIIVAHDWLELGMISNLGLQHRVVQWLHGDYDYYYSLAIKHAPYIDAFITVSDSIRVKLINRVAERYQDIHYLRFPVPESNCPGQKPAKFSIIFIGRCTREKGYHLLPAIAAGLEQAEVKASWHIVGEQEASMHELFPWDDNIDVTIHGGLKNEKVRLLLCSVHLIVLPSIAEGMPISIIEAMKAGVVPIVYDIKGGIQEIVVENETGFKVKVNEVTGYIDILKKLIADKSNFEFLQKNCRTMANQLFDPLKNTLAVENVLLGVAVNPKKRKMPRKVYGSRLDARWLPNWTARAIRNIWKG